MTLDNFIAGLEILKKYLPSKGASKWFLEYSSLVGEYYVPVSVIQCHEDSVDGQQLLQLEFRPVRSNDGTGISCWVFDP